MGDPVAGRGAAVAGRPVPATGVLPARPAGRSRTERGAVTAELAAVLPVACLLLLVLGWVLSLLVTQVRVVDAARETARVAARGEPIATAVDHGRRVAPGAARITVRRGHDLVRVSVVTHAGPQGGLLGLLPDVEVTAVAVAAVEPQ